MAELFEPGETRIIGMVHARALPGSPGYGGDWPAVIEAARRDAAALVEGGVDAVMVENFGDVPFYRGRVPAETVACLTVLASAVREATGGPGGAGERGLPVGVNVLRNDGASAVAVALAAGASFVRVNVLAGAVVADQGVVKGDAAGLMRQRRAMGAGHVAVVADVRVKHAAPLAGTGWLPIDQEVEELVLRAGATAVVVSGSGTGKPTDLGEVGAAARAARACGERLNRAVPVWVGSGVTVETAASLARVADGLIVGTSLKEGGRVDAPVDLGRVRDLVWAARCG